MKTCFHGDLEDFEAFVLDLQLLAWVKELPNGVYRVSCADGSNMNWSSTTKRVWFDGDTEAARGLEDLVKQYFEVEHLPQFMYRS